MRRHRSAVLLAAGSAVLAALLIAGVISAMHGRDQGAAAHIVGGGQSAAVKGDLLSAGRKVPGVPLLDAHGHRTSLAAYRGKELVVLPFMTLCHEVCPMTDQVAMQIKRTLAHRRTAKPVAVVEVTVDPWRDHPKRLRAFQRLIGSHVTMLTGSKRSIAAVWKFFGVYYQRVAQGKPPDTDWLTHKPERFDVQHTDGAFIVDPHGDERIALVGMPTLSGHTIDPSLKKLLNQQGVDNLRHPDRPWSAADAVHDAEWLAAHPHAHPRAGGSVIQVAPTTTTSPASTPPATTTAPAGTATAPVPATLAGLRAQANQLLTGGLAAVRSRLAALRGHPVVVNEWASWCAPCRQEFGYLRAAQQRYAGRVAFFGVDVADQASSARSFLAAHPVGYPSYTDPGRKIFSALGPTNGTPITLFYDAQGRRVGVHIGQYSSQQELDSDIANYLGA